MSAEERSAIERRAMDVASAHLIAQGYTIKDVGATEPYDIDAHREDGKHLFVEVKGTTSLGTEVVLTHGEVRLMKEQHPNTALMVVQSIRLDRPDGELTASGGDLHVTHPWKIDDIDLAPVSYRYTVPRPDGQ